MRALLDEAFPGDVTEDYEHALGGMHALVWEGPVPVGHGSVVMSAQRTTREPSACCRSAWS